MNLSAGEIFILAILALVIFGPDRLPGMARQAGRVWRSFQTESNKALGEFRSIGTAAERAVDPSPWAGSKAEGAVAPAAGAVTGPPAVSRAEPKRYAPPAPRAGEDLLEDT